MAVTREFLQAVDNKNVLRMRLIMKNSLLIDTSFNDFLAMEKVANDHGIDVWQHTSEFELTKREKPWSLDDMNYELTAIVNDFTKEHMDYLMDIIREVYAKNPSVNKEKYIYGEPVRTNNTQLPSKKVQKTVQLREYYSELIVQLEVMTKVLRNNRKNQERKLSKTDIEKIRWTSSLISQVRTAAKRIVELCDQIEGRKN